MNMEHPSGHPEESLTLAQTRRRHAELERRRREVRRDVRNLSWKETVLFGRATPSDVVYLATATLLDHEREKLRRRWKTRGKVKRGNIPLLDGGPPTTGQELRSGTQQLLCEMDSGRQESRPLWSHSDISKALLKENESRNDFKNQFLNYSSPPELTQQEEQQDLGSLMVHEEVQRLLHVEGMLSDMIIRQQSEICEQLFSNSSELKDTTNLAHLVTHDDCLLLCGYLCLMARAALDQARLLLLEGRTDFSAIIRLVCMPSIATPGSDAEEHIALRSLQRESPPGPMSEHLGEYFANTEGLEVQLERYHRDLAQESNVRDPGRLAELGVKILECSIEWQTHYESIEAYRHIAIRKWKSANSTRTGAPLWSGDVCDTTTIRKRLPTAGRLPAAASSKLQEEQGTRAAITEAERSIRTGQCMSPVPH